MKQSLGLKNQELIKSKHIIIFVLALAFVMRLVVINQSLWLDEVIGAIAVRDYSYGGIIRDFLKFDNHPPLYYLGLKLWTDIFGYTEISLRMPSVIYGVLTVYITYLIAKKVISKRPFAEIVVFLLATSPFHIYYSQEARMYSLAAFLASLAVYSFLFLIEEVKIKSAYWLLFSFSITALVFTDYVPIFLLPVFWVFSLLKKKKRKWWVKFVLLHVPLLLFGLLWLPTFLVQAEKGRWLLATLPAWRQVAGGANIKQAALVWMKFVLGRISLRDKALYYALVGVASLPFIAALFRSVKSKQKKSLLWFWLVVPLTLGLLASFWFPVFVYFRFLYVIPAFYLIIASGVLEVKRGKARILLTASLLAVNFLGWSIYVAEPYQQREHWRQATFFVEEKAKITDAVIFEYPEPFAPYRWYAKGKARAFGVTDSISANPSKTRDKTEKTISGKTGVYYFEYLRDLSDPQRVVEATLRHSGFEVEKVYDFFPGVGQIFYWTKL